ncbi:MAG: TIR domain-containing protein [Bryobacteraceae bacterium]|nr:TIR domain-containing protein [Bryobacteraceae bacterium]
MLEVFLCHSRADRDLAQAIADRLDRTAEAHVNLEACPSAAGQTVAEAWEAGLSCAAVLLLLTPDAAPERLRREDWEGLLRHKNDRLGTPVAVILAADCRYPRLLERGQFYRWIDDPSETLREIAKWVLSLHPDVASQLAPDPLPWFDGRGPELNELRETLADAAGAVVLINDRPGSGKTALAQQFAHSASPWFRDIVWVDCGGRSQTAVVSELASHVGVAAEGSLPVIAAAINSALTNRRLLIVLDDLDRSLPFDPPVKARSSLLVTTRREDFKTPEHATVMRVGAVGVPPSGQPADSDARRLLQAISACRPNGFPMALAARIAGLDEGAAAAACACLQAERRIDPFVAPRGRYRLNGCGRLAEELPAPDTEALRRRHAEELTALFAEWRTQPDRSAQLLPELDSALEWALRVDWNLAKRLAECAFAAQQSQARRLDAAGTLDCLLAAAEKRRDEEVAAMCRWELSWLRDFESNVQRPPAAGDQLAFDFS